MWANRVLKYLDLLSVLSNLLLLLSDICVSECLCSDIAISLIGSVCLTLMLLSAILMKFNRLKRALMMSELYICLSSHLPLLICFSYQLLCYWIYSHQFSINTSNVIFRYKEDSKQPFPSSPGSGNSVNTNNFVGSSDSNDKRSLHSQNYFTANF